LRVREVVLQNRRDPPDQLAGVGHGERVKPDRVACDGQTDQLAGDQRRAQAGPVGVQRRRDPPEYSGALTPVAS
jgi:hypothetical protein